MNDDFDLKAEEDGGKRPKSKKRLVVALVLLGIVALSFKVHWIAGYGLLITSLLFLIFYLPPPELRRLLITFYLFFVITLLTSTGLQMFLASNKTVARLVAENKVMNFLVGGLVIAVLITAVSFWISLRIGRSLEAMMAGTSYGLRKELGHRFPDLDSDEVIELAESVNRLTEESAEQIRAARSQDNKP